MKPDFVAELLEVVDEVVPLDDQGRLRLRKLIRLRFGGQRAWIRAQDPVQARVPPEQIEARLRARKKVEAIADEFGIGRTTMYRLLRKSQKRP